MALLKVFVFSFCVIAAECHFGKLVDMVVNGGMNLLGLRPGLHEMNPGINYDMYPGMYPGMGGGMGGGMMGYKDPAAANPIITVADQVDSPVADAAKQAAAAVDTVVKPAEDVMENVATAALDAVLPKTNEVSNPIPIGIPTLL